MESTIIIPTKNRKHILYEAIESILDQTVLPKEIIIVDQSNILEKVRDQIENAINVKGLRHQIVLKYIHDSSIDSLTKARNIGVSFAETGVVLFLDDDVILEPSYIKAILGIYEKCPDIGGVGGVVTNYNLSLLQRLYYRLFYLGPFRDLRLEICSNLKKYSLKKYISTNKLAGCLSSYRRSVLDKYKFDENYIGYSPGEDTDFSYRVSHSNKLLIAPSARAYHKSSYSTTNVEAFAKLAERHVGCWWYFYLKNVHKNMINTLCYLWINFGFLLTAVISLIKNREELKLCGTLSAFNKILKYEKFDFIKMLPAK